MSNSENQNFFFFEVYKMTHHREHRCVIGRRIIIKSQEKQYEKLNEIRPKNKVEKSKKQGKA